MEKGLAKIKVVGIGGSGGNAVNRMKKCNIKGAELISLNTDSQDLSKVSADVKIRIGKKITKGLGAGMSPDVGRKAAMEALPEISESLLGADLIFITCGLGGGTGSGASDVVAAAAKQTGALTLAVVTKPFSFEGQVRQKIAENASKRIKEKVDTLISISNDRLLTVLDPNVSLVNAFWVCDDILRQAVQGISDLIMLPGIINVDFADVRSVMSDAGSALFGVGKAQGEGRAEKAALEAVNSHLLSVSIKGAKGLLFNVSGGEDISLTEIDKVAKTVTKEVNPEAKVIFGAVQDEKLKKGEIKVTVIATGF